MRNAATRLAIAGLLALAGCGGDESPVGGAGGGTDPETQETPAGGGAAAGAGDEAAQEKAKGTTITVGDSEFGRMLFSSEKQAIYIFEKDPRGESACYDECAEAWPPVITRGDPVAAPGVDADLLGTTERRDGALQVTYDGKPLYYYAHEEPGEVRCHDVELNGGLWWVVGPDGDRRP